MNTTDTDSQDNQTLPTPPKKKSRHAEERDRISVIRRANFNSLCDKFDAKEMMERMKWKTQGQLSQLKTGSHRSSFADSMARRIERTFKLEPYWLDKEQGGVTWTTTKLVPAGTNMFSDKVSSVTITTALQAVDRVIADTKTELTPEKKAVLYQIVFALVVTNGWTLNLELIGLLVSLGRL